MKLRISRWILAFCWGGIALAAGAQGDNPDPNAPQPAAPANVPTAQTPPLPTAPATPPGNPPPPLANSADLWSQNYLTGNWGGFRDELKNHGVTFTPNYTAEVFGNPSGGRRQGVVTDGLLDAELTIDLDPLTNGAIKDTSFYAEAFYIYGSNLSTQSVGDFSITSNIAAYNTLRLQELWLQKLFWNKKLSVKIGNMAVDNEFFQSNSASLFISGTFGGFTLIANNVVNAPIYPLASPGVRVQLLPTAQTYVMAGVFGQDAKSNPAVNNQNGTLFALNSKSGMLVMSEAGFLLNQGPKDKGLQGTYRLGSFLDTSNHATFASQAAFSNGSGPLRSAGTNFGIYGVMDQQIYSKDSEILSLFVRSGSAPSNTNFVDYYMEGGFNFAGFVPGRDKDVGGLAVARSHVSGDYSDSQVAQGNPPSTAETVIEATYKVQFAPWWSIQPDLQYIVTPSGVQGSHNALVLGVRTNMAF
jgi:porin